MLDIKKTKVINNHHKLFNTYKELNNLLPFGYIKTRISPGQKYSFQRHPIIINLEKEKDKEISPTKITKNLLYNKNIYIFSEENDCTKKIISKLKKYYSYNKTNRMPSLQSESNATYNEQNSSNYSRNTNNLNSFEMNANTIKTKKTDIYKNTLNENEHNNNELNKNEFEIYPDYSGKIFKSSSINNCIMKNNIYLPNIIDRMKNCLPRYQRESHGFLLNGYGKKSFQKLNDYKDQETLFNNNNIKKSIFSKNKSGLILLKKYDIKNDDIKNTLFSRKRKHKTNLYKKNLKLGNSIEITGIKKISKIID